MSRCVSVICNGQWFSPKEVPGERRGAREVSDLNISKGAEKPISQAKACGSSKEVTTSRGSDRILCGALPAFFNILQDIRRKRLWRGGEGRRGGGYVSSEYMRLLQSQD